mgnify:CR=1 FL=1
MAVYGIRPKTFLRKWGAVATSEISMQDHAIKRVGLPTEIKDAFRTIQQLVAVGKSGAQYTSVNSAVSDITDATAAKAYGVKIGGGVFAEQLTSKKYVHLIGDGIDNTVLQYNSTTGAIKITWDSGDLMITDMSIENTATGATNCLLHRSSASGSDIRVYFYNCKFKGLGRLFDASTSIGTTFYFFNCIFETPSADSLDLLYQLASTDYYFVGCHIKTQCYFSFAGSSATTNFVKLLNCYMQTGHSTPFAVGLLTGSVSIIGGEYDSSLSSGATALIAVGKDASYHIQGARFKDSGSTVTTDLITSAGTLILSGCDLEGGTDALAVTAGTTTIIGGRFDKDGTGYDINVTGGTCNAAFAYYATSSGTITVPSADYVKKAGDTMTGDLNMGGSYQVVGLQAPAASGEALRQTATLTEAAAEDAVTKKHAQSHSIISTADHTSAATSGKMLKADANGLPINATNTDADVADAVTKKHTQNTDTKLQDGASVDSVTVETGGIVNLPKQSASRAYLTTASQSINTDTSTKITLNAESYDNQNEFDSTTNYRFTATKAGYYLIIANSCWDSPVTAKRYISAIYKNGAAIVSKTIGTSGTETQDVTIATIIYLAANDYLEFFVNQNSGAADTVYFGADRTYMCVSKLS